MSWGGGRCAAETQPLSSNSPHLRKGSGAQPGLPRKACRRAERTVSGVFGNPRRAGCGRVKGGRPQTEAVSATRNQGRALGSALGTGGGSCGCRGVGGLWRGAAGGGRSQIWHTHDNSFTFLQFLFIPYRHNLSPEQGSLLLERRGSFRPAPQWLSCSNCWCFLLSRTIFHSRSRMM